MLVPFFVFQCLMASGWETPMVRSSSGSCSATKCPGATSSNRGEQSVSPALMRVCRNFNLASGSSTEGSSPNLMRLRPRSIFGSGTGTAEISVRVYGWRDLGGSIPVRGEMTL